MHLGEFSLCYLKFNQFSQHVLLQIGIFWSLVKFHKTLFNNLFFSSVLPSQISQDFSFSILDRGRRWEGVDNRQQKDNIKYVWIHVAMDNR